MNKNNLKTEERLPFVRDYLVTWNGIRNQNAKYTNSSLIL